MNTKERIQKFLQGRAISRKDYDEAKARYDEAFANATEEQKQMAGAYLQSVLNKQSADPKTNKHARHMGAEAYRVATTMLNGTFDANAAQTPLGTTGPRTRRQDYADANNVAADFMRKNANRQTTTGGTGKGTVTSGGRYYFDALKGLSRIGELAGTTTRGALVKGYAQQLLKNITDAENAEQQGNTVYNGVEGMYGDKAALEAIINGDVESDNAYNTLLGIAGKYEDGNTWKAWFGDYLPKVSEEDKRRAEVLKNYSEVDTSSFSEGVRNALSQNNVRLLKDKENNYKLFRKDWTDYTGNGFDWIDLNQGNTYGHGILAGTDGRVFIGNTADINDSHWAKDLFGGVKDRIYNQYNPVYTRKKFNLVNDYSEENLINEYIRGLESAGYKNPDASYTDVSKLFNGTSKVIAYNPNGTELGTGAFGELVLSPDTQFMWENADGSFGRGTLEDAKQKLGGFNLKGYDTEANEQLGALSDLSGIFEGAEGLSGDTKLTKNDFKKGLLGSITMGIIPYGLYRLFANDTIGNKPQTFVDLAVQALKDPQKKLDVPGRIMDMTGSEFLAQFGTRSQLLETIGRFVNEGAKLSPQDLRWIKNMYYTAEKSRLDSEVKTRKHAQGGILYAADGTALFVNQERPTNNWHEKYDKSAALKKEDADIEKAQQEGYKSAEHYRANKNTDHLSTADMMRIGTIAADVTSIIASFTSGTGVGAAVAEGAGLASFGIDTVADIIDPSVSSGEVLKNGLINAGLAAVSFIPGAKIPSTLGKVIKYAPKVLLAASAMGIAMDESVQNTFKKVTEGKEKLNTEDWRNIAHIFTLVAAGSRAGRQGYEKFRAKKDLKGTPKNMLDVKQGNTKIGEIPMDKKSELASIEKLAKEGKLEGKYGAIEKLAFLLNKTPDEVKGFFSENNKITGVVKGKNSLNLKTSEQKTDVDIDKALDAFEQAKYSGNSNWAWLRNAPTWRQRGIMDATGIYPTGIVGNKSTQGVAEEMRRRLPKKPMNEVIQEQTSKQPKALPAQKENSTAQQPYNGSDLIADGIHQNPTSVESPIKTPNEIPTEIREITSAQKARSTKAVNSLFKQQSKMLSREQIAQQIDKLTTKDLQGLMIDKDIFVHKYIGTDGKSRYVFGTSVIPGIGDKNVYTALELAKLFKDGIIPIRYAGNRPMLDYNSGQTRLPFKDGGKVNYQKLRK